MPHSAMKAQLEQRLRVALAPELELLHPIGAGGMAQVFLAREAALRRVVAVKVLSVELANSPEARARFGREAQAVASLSHPNIVAVHRVGKLDDGTPYFVMQFVEGQSMADRVAKHGPLAVDEARRVLGEVASALATAHAAGIIHRDIKPANILHEESTGRALVSDFGIAAMSEVAKADRASGAQGASASAPVATPADPAAMKLTATGAIIGTPQYMSPEQLLAEPVTDKTDVFSLGLLAHSLLTGEGPFQATSPYEMMAAVVRDTPKRLAERRPDVDHELDELVSRCLEKKAAARPTAAELAQRLAPGTASLIEWPAPGLEPLLGGLRRVSLPWLYCSGIVTIVMLAYVVAGPALNSPVASVGALLLTVAMLGNLFFLVTAVRRTIRVGLRTARAIRAGYAWITVIETLSDIRGDTGNLVAGAREYAAVTPAGRDKYRENRIRRELAMFGAGTLALPLMVVCLAFASETGRVLWVSIEPLLMFGLGLDAFLRANREASAFRDKRRKRAAADAADVRRLANPWNDAFDRVSQGQALGRGRRTRVQAGVGTAIVAAVITLASATLLAPFVLVATIGPFLMNEPRLGEASDRLRMAAIVKPFVLPKDSSITPVQAGDAIRAIIASSPNAPTRQLFSENPETVRTSRAPWSDSLPTGTFLAARDRRQYAGLPSALDILKLARRGFTSAEMAYLERIAHAPQWKLYETVARAPRVDYYGAWLQLPLPDTVIAFDLPVPPSGTVRSFAEASVSRAAYYVARGQRDSAEYALRLTASAGLTLANDAVTVTNELVGVIMASYARQGLIDLWDLTSDARGRSLQAQLEGSVATITGQQQLAALPSLADRDVRHIRSAAIAIATNPKAPIAHRFEALNALAIAPCTNVRELLFGFDDDINAAFAAVRRDVRSPVDSAIIDMQYHAVERFRHLVTKASGASGLYRTMALAGAAMLNKRFAGCTSLLLSRRAD